MKGPSLPRSLCTLTLLALAFGATSCVRDVGPGPDLGPCAAPPDGVYTYGEIGIGTCLAGPADLQFFEQDGQTWLAVTNANPFLNYSSGSVLLIDWDTVDPTRRENRIDQLDAHALPMDNYVGGIGYVSDPFKKVLLVAGRYSEGASTTSNHDELWVLDVSTPSAPVPWDLGEQLTLRDDPQPVVVDPTTGLAFVVNITDHSVSVLDTSEAPIRSVEVAGAARVNPDRYFDLDHSGSRAEVSVTILEDEEIPNEHWTLNWIEGTTQVWVPEAGGLRHWSTGGLDYVTSGWGLELDPADSPELLTQVTDPFHSDAASLPGMLFGDDGDIKVAYATTAGSWDLTTLSWVVHANSNPEAWDAWLDAPSELVSDAGIAVYYDARTAPGEPASIGVASGASSDGLARFGTPLLAPTTPWVSLEDPFVRNDDLAQRKRMWLSLWDGTRWSIGLSESSEGLAWTPVEEILAVDGVDVAAPVLDYANGRYHLWMAYGDGASWSIAHAWSYDGRDFSDPEVVVDVLGEYDLMAPPRVAIDGDVTGGFTVEGDEAGRQPGVATTGGSFLVSDQGMSLRVANGQVVSGSDVGDTAVNGVHPGSRVEFNGRTLLFTTGFDDLGRASLAVLEERGTGWSVLSEDLIADGVGNNLAGVRDPAVVVSEDRTFLTLFYSALDNQGIWRLRRATSGDGVNWQPRQIATPALAIWEALGRTAHGIERLDDGSVRVWYTGYSETSSAIGALTTDNGADLQIEEGYDASPRFDVGTPGTFDDSGVKDPVVVSDGEQHHLWYAGSDGDVWRLGHATAPLPTDTDFERDKDPATGEPRATMVGQARTFSTGGTTSPVVWVDSATGEFSALYAGFDGVTYRVGSAVGRGDILYPTQRFPTPGDRIEFSTNRGDPDGGVIELEQVIDGFGTSGIGASSARLDDERGFLYITAKRTLRPANYIYVVDVRDDGTDGTDDANYLDIEAILQVGATSYSTGFRDALPIPGTDLLYASGHVPDSVVVFDLSELEDDDDKQLLQDVAVGSLPLQRMPSTGTARPYQDEDAGETTEARFSGAGMALAPDGHTLLVTHYRDNSVAVFDLNQGAFGEEIRRIADVGENPHLIRVSPDGRYAVVANYLGEVEDNTVSSTLAVIDLDPTSETYLEVVTWLTNR